MAASPESEPTAVQARRERLLARLGGGSLRTHTAGGVLINGAWSIGLQGLGFLRGFIVAAFLAPHDYGVWAIIIVGYSMLGVLRQVGIGDKYVQQDDPDEEAAFQKAFTLEAILSGGLWLILMLFTPVVALIYRAPEIVAPGLIALLAMPGAILQTPVWAYHRDMDFRRERRLTAIDPIVAMVVTAGLAIAGAGYWSFAIGNVAGTWAGAIVILRHAPYPLRFRYDRGTARSYVKFSTPLLLSNLSSIVLVQGTTLFARSAVGIAGVGALALANSVRTYTAFADGIISASMYPAICAMKDRRAVLHESFVKSNRLALMWGFPVGIGVALFGGDLIHFVLGDRWQFAVTLFQAVGIVSAIGHLAFNWDNYVRAVGDTKPVAVYAWIGLLGWAAGPVPLLLADGLRGYGIGLFVVALLNLVVRAHFMRRFFPGFAIWRHALRAIAPTVPAVGAVLLLRLVESPARPFGLVVGEVAVYVGVTAAATWLTERALLREAIGYLRRSRGLSPSPA
jgi:O-antigen/teichoic acid export membrane protein